MQELRVIVVSLCIGLIALSCTNDNESIHYAPESPEKITHINNLNMTEEVSYPNVYLKVRLTQTDLTLPKLEGIFEIWMKDSECKVSDNTGRYGYEILNDFKHERGLGQPPSSMEEIMDIQTRRTSAEKPVPIQFYLDTQSMKGSFKKGDEASTEMDASELFILPGKFLSANLREGLEPDGDTTFLGLKCDTYSVDTNGEIDNGKYTTHHRIIAYKDYILFSEAKDSVLENYALKLEVIEMKEGKVTDSDFHL